MAARDALAVAGATGEALRRTPAEAAPRPGGQAAAAAAWLQAVEPLRRRPAGALPTPRVQRLWRPCGWP